MEEIWKDVKGYENKYQISNLGRVKSIERKTPFRNSFITINERILKEIVDKDGYKVVNLYNKGKRKMFKIHRLVAEAFIPNPDNLPQINHKDENKQNNCVENLEYCDARYNINYGHRNTKASQTSFNGKKSKKVCQYTLCGELLKVWPSVHETGRNGFDSTGVSSCCNGKIKTYKGFKWSFET